MLQTRLWMGAILIALTLGVLVVDQWLAPWYPFLFVAVLGLALIACREFLGLVDPVRRPPGWLCYGSLVGLIVANWLPHVSERLSRSPWDWIVGVFAGIVLAAFLVEMARFRLPGESLNRIAMTIFIVGYLGLLPSFLAQLRWLPGVDGQLSNSRGSVALGLVIFVPKCGDIGAYFTGRLLGHHKMSPVLSPKKTWEGAAGGMVAAVLAAGGINRIETLNPVIQGGLLSEVGFGLSLGVAGLLGDLAESLIKRDCGQKDASQVVPGFGGVLDVVDAVLFASPVAYGWLHAL